MMLRQARKGGNGMRHTPFKYLTIVIFALALVSPLKGATPKSYPRYFGTYLNEGDILIEIDIVSKDGREGTTIPLDPNHIDRTDITPGTTRLYLPSRSGEKRRLLWSGPTPTPTTVPGYFEKETRMFYLRIIGRKVILVKPRDLTDVERRNIKAVDEVLRRDAERR
jgi:hypothetical protein